MPNKTKLHKREDWISIVVTVLFILGFLALANSGAIITGFTTAEQLTTIEFGVNSVIPSTAILEIISGTQTIQQNLSEFTIKLSDLASIQPILENNTLVAYNITNITIDLAEYSIQPADSISIKFIEIYKEITREAVTQRITKEENITKEIIAVTENVTEISEENLTAEPIIPENITEIAPIENVTIAEITEELEFAVQPAEEFRITQTAIFTENWDDGDDVGWTDERTFYAPNTAQKRSGSYSELFAGNSDARASLRKSATIDLTGKTSGNATFYAYILAAVDAGEYCCLDLSPDGVTWNNGTAGTADCANGQAGTGAQEAVWISVSRALNSSYYNSNFKIAFTCNSNAASESIYIDDIIVYAEVADTDTPVINLQSPINNTNSTSSYINFTYNVTDASSAISSCNLWLQKSGAWQLNLTDSSVTETVNQTFNLTIEDSSILWLVECNDSSTSNNKANSTTYNLTVDVNSPPNIQIYAPANNTYSLSHSVNFTYNVTDTDFMNGNGVIVNCTLLLQKNGGWQYNASNSSAITEGINQTINITLGHENINWTIECIDGSGLKANATVGYFNYTVYTSSPAVSLVWPFNNTYQTGSYYVNFTYNITGLDSTYTCDLYINEQWNATDTTITETINQTFNLSFASYQNLNWSIGCNSTYNEYANSTIYNYSILEQQNQPPTIPVSNITQLGSTSITLDDKTQVSFTFVACDSEGSADIDMGFANMTGEANFLNNNLTCGETAWTNTTCKQFNCTFDFWYWYKAGFWNYSMNVTDGTEWTHANASTFQLGETTGMVMSPTYLGWSSINSGDTNKTTTNDPIIVNNTGNYNVSLSKVNVTAYDLHGEAIVTSYIDAGNFTVDIETGGACTGADCIECDGTLMANATSKDITNSMLPRGNHSIGDGTAQEQLYFCLTRVPTGLGVQSFSTQNSQQWLVGIS